MFSLRGEGPQLSWPGGYPHLGLGYHPAWDWGTSWKGLGTRDLGKNPRLEYPYLQVWTDRHLWKHYLPNPSDTGGNKKKIQSSLLELLDRSTFDNYIVNAHNADLWIWPEISTGKWETSTWGPYNNVIDRLGFDTPFRFDDFYHTFWEGVIWQLSLVKHFK